MELEERTEERGRVEGSHKWERRDDKQSQSIHDLQFTNAHLNGMHTKVFINPWTNQTEQTKAESVASQSAL